jgi:hypothetical protein
MRVVEVVFVCVMMSLCPWTVPAASLTLAWDRSPDVVGGYALYVGDAPGSYQRRVDAGDQTNLLVTNLTSGVRYYFTVTAYSRANVESAPANEVSYLVPGAFYLSPGPAAGVQLNFVCEPGKTYSLQASTNLVDWVEMGSVQSQTNAWLSQLDPASTTLVCRFYRIQCSP